MKAYNKIMPEKRTMTTIGVNKSYKGETIEQKINRIVNNKEPITDGAPLIYTDRADGVQPQYDIRTDRFEIAIDAMDAVTKTHQAKREERQKKKDDDKKQAAEKQEKFQKALDEIEKGWKKEGGEEGGA